MRLLYALLLSGIILAVGLSVALPDATLVASGLTIAAAAVGLVLVNRTQRIIAAVLLGVGLASVVLALQLGGQIDGPDLLAVNQDLIGMLTAVSFLRLVTPTVPTTRARLHGRLAVVRTALATHALGAIINIGAVGIVGAARRRHAVRSRLMAGAAALRRADLACRRLLEPRCALNSFALSGSCASTPKAGSGQNSRVTRELRQENAC